MGNCFRRKNVLICDKISEDYSYLQAKGKITCRSDPQFNIVNLKVDANGSYSEEIRILPNNENYKKWNVFRTSSLAIS